MKLIRFGEFRSEKPGVLIDGKRLDCTGRFDDWNHDFFQNDGINLLSKFVEENGDNLPTVGDDVRWGAPVARPGKVLCIGLNYSDHAAETGMKIPEEPILFMKGSNTVVGPYDNIMIPRKSKKTDWEVELGVIIGRDTRYLDSPEQAVDCVAGYTISNDVSEREFQAERGGQWTKGKSCDTFNPLGPSLLTPDEIDDIDNLNMTLSVNGESRQNGSTSTMIFSVPVIVHYLSQFLTLEAGDVITTGTPPGVGLGMNPPQFLKAGDVVELSIEGFGTQRQECIDA